MRRKVVKNRSALWPRSTTAETAALGGVAVRLGCLVEHAWLPHDKPGRTVVDICIQAATLPALGVCLVGVVDFSGSMAGRALFF